MRRMCWLGWVSMWAIGCAGPGSGGSTTTRTPVDPGIADPAGSFERAQANGELDAQTCQQHADAFEVRFAESRDPMDKFNVGVVWEACGQPDSAAAAYRDVIRLEPSFALAHNGLGTLEYRAGRADASEQHFLRAVNAQPRSIPPRHNLAHVYRARYLATGQTAAFDQAERQHRAVLAVDSDNLDAYVGLARLYYDRAATGERSYALLSQLVVTQAMLQKRTGGETSADLWNVQGLLFVLRADPTGAVKSFRTAVDLDANHVDARINAALVELELRNFEAAADDLKTAVKLAEGQRAVEATLALGVARRGLRDFEGAERAYSRVSTLDSTDPRPAFNTGVLYQDHIGPANDGSNGVAENDVAKEQFTRFVKIARNDAGMSGAVAAAKRRIATIDEYADIVRAQEELAREAKRLEELALKQREARRKELLELERKAQERWERSADPSQSSSE